MRADGITRSRARGVGQSNVWGWTRRVALASSVVILLSGAVVAASPGAAQAATDTTPPTLVSFTLSPTSVDTTSGAKTITVTAHITDDSSGFSSGYFSFYGPSYQSLTASFSSSSRISGTTLDGTYQTTMTVGQYVQSGTWTFDYGDLSDVSGNDQYYDLRDFAQQGFSSTFTKSGPSDTTAPQPASFSMSTQSVDTTAGAKSITLSFQIVDDLSGFSSGYIQFDSEDYGYLYASFSSANRVSGNALSGTYSVTLTVPQYAADGYWTVDYADFTDAVGNDRSYYSSSFEQTGFPYYFYKSGPVDMTDPAMQSFAFTPTSIDTTSGDQSITVTARFTDDRSGFSSAYVGFYSNSYDEYVEADFSASDRISGTALDGIYQTTMTVPQGSERGFWTVDDANVRDVVGNSDYLGLSDFVDAGFPTTFTNGQAAAPSAPLNVSASAGDSSARVSWSAPSSDGGSPITSYTVSASPGGATATVDGSSTSATVTGLTNGTAYTFTVKATNAIGPSAASTPSNAVTPAKVPGAPTNVTATAGSQSAAVSWTAPPNNGSAITSYTVTSSPDSVTSTVPGNQTSASVTGLTNGTSYTFTVKATNGTGTGLASAPSNAVVPGGSAPALEVPTTGFAFPATVGTSTISAVEKWAEGTSPSGICSYDLQESVAGGPFTEVALPNPTATSVPVTLTPATSYRFELNVTNCLGQSSGWGVQASEAPLAWQENNKKVKYTGAWTKQTTSSAYGGALEYSTAKNATVTEKFQGLGIAWVSDLGPTYGAATVYLDGVKQKTVNLHSATPRSRQVVWKQGWSFQSAHTIKVVVTGTKGHARVDLDAFMTFHLQ